MSILSFLKKNKKKISGTTRDYSTLNTYDKKLKVWLPEIAKTALNEMSDSNNISISDLIRQALFVYLYGRYDISASIEEGEHDFTMGKIAFSRTPEFNNRTSDAGKNTYDVKVMIASQMKDDLQELADKARIKLSEFIREVLISSLFGHTYLSERDEMLSFRIKIE